MDEFKKGTLVRLTDLDFGQPDLEVGAEGKIVEYVDTDPGEPTNERKAVVKVGTKKYELHPVSLAEIED